MEQLLAAAGASGSWDWDLVEGSVHFDDRLAALYGLEPEAALAGLPAETFFSIIHPDDRARVRIGIAGVMAGAELFTREFRVLMPGGGEAWMQARGRSHFDGQDRPVRFTGLFINITERRRTEEQLRIAQSAGGVGTFEYVGGFATVTVSAEFCRLLGLHPVAVLPVSTINRVCGDCQVIPEAGSAAPETLDAEFPILRGDTGAARWIARRGEIMRERSGYRLIGVIYDITTAKEQEARLRDLNDTLEARVEQEVAERREAEEALRQAQKMEAVGQLTGGIAHDFNNLLTIIIGNIDTVLRRFDTSHDPRAKRSLESALKGAERAASLTQRLLAFSRRQPLAPKTIDVGRLLAGMSDLLTRAIAETIAIQISAAPDLWAIESDPHQLENAILNLAVNARDAMPAGGTLTIEAANVVATADDERLAPGEYVVISVVDCGVGMTAETVARVFDPFFTTKEVGKGTGLGLSMVYGFVKQSGGHVTIDSTVGEGTAVRLYLERKLSTDDAAAETGQAATEGGNASEQILVVEDDDDVRAYTVGILRELGYRVIEAHDGASALTLLDREDFDPQLLLTDVVMPRMSGRELADQARLRRPALKVLYTSGYSRDSITRDGRLEPGVDLISKPFAYATLAAKVRDLLDRAA